MKRASVWLQCGFVILCLLGVVALGMGFLLPVGYHPNEIAAGNMKSPVSDLDKKSEVLSRQLKGLLGESNLGDGTPSAHRVFVSRTLLFLPKEKESVQPLSENLVTSDGINVSWKIQNGFDLQDPNLAQQDDDSDGFTNKEEFDKGTDPNNSSSSPSRWIKIKIATVETNSLGVGFSGKSGDRFTLRFLFMGKKKDVDVTLGDKLWVAVAPKGPEVLKSDSEAKKTIQGGTCPHAIPLVVKKYQEDKGKRVDEKTKTENDYDDSYLELERLDGIGGVSKIKIDERGKSRGVSWSVGDIRFISLVPGEGEMGPYRVGQSFSYAGKEFVIQAAATNKVSLWMKPEGEEVQVVPRTP